MAVNTPLPPVHHENHLFKFSSSHLASIFVSVLTAGMVGSFSLLWSMSHSLTRINERLDVLYSRFQSLDSDESSIQRDLVLLERRLSILEQKVSDHARPN
jgi:sensor histidine kinase YesM